MKAQGNKNGSMTVKAPQPKKPQQKPKQKSE